MDAEHTAAVLNETNINLIDTWTLAEIDAEIKDREMGIKLSAIGQTDIHEAAWKFCLFPKDQRRDENKYPVEYENEDILVKKERYMTSCREMLARITVLDPMQSPSFDLNRNETTRERRVKRLMKFRQNMYKQFKLWEDTYQMVNFPAMVCVGVDDDTSKNTPYQKVLIHILERCYENKYRRSGDFCCVQIGQSRAWKQAKEIKDFVYEETRKEDNLEMWKNLTSKGSCVSEVVKHITNCIDHQFRDIRKNRHVWSFNNGLFHARVKKESSIVCEFYEYTSKEFQSLDPTIVSSKYFEQPFNPFTEVEDWYDIPTPFMQKIMDYQNFEPDVCKWMYVFLGRLCYDVNDMDSWQVIPFLKGIARSGKSTIITKVAKKFYDTTDVKILSNNIEKKFGLEAIHDCFMFISPEIKGDLSLDQAEFQSLVSGEPLSFARKNRSAMSVTWKTPGVLGGNEVPLWTDKSGSILRRIFPWDFSRQVLDADPHLDDKLDKEIPAILCKCVRAYLDYADKFSDKDIWNVVPKYFLNIQDQVAMVTNVLRHFLASEKLVFGPDQCCTEKKFKEKFKQHINENSFPPTRGFSQDLYGGPFSSLNIVVKRDAGLALKHGWTADEMLLVGVSVKEPTVQIGSHM